MVEICSTLRRDRVIQGDKFSLYIKDIESEFSKEATIIVIKGLLKLKPKTFQRNVGFLQKYIYDLLSTNFHIFIVIADEVLLDTKIVEEGFIYRGLKGKAGKDFPDILESELGKEVELIIEDLRVVFNEVRTTIEEYFGSEKPEV